MALFRNLAMRFALPSVQLAIAMIIVVISSLLTVGVFLRFIPPLQPYAIGAGEPFWVLLLSVLALLFAGYTALPAALAYREVKGNGSANGER
jgi:hypothetical protein